ncbi:hypothetical protein ACFWWC_41195 [Streptomyces sp. NPDC058642]|uniref:hypothetical protein n=1 Tax=Streptomyces sp. NPDC058642 TaxID=3346572 RepID=UPI00365330DF
MAKYALTVRGVLTCLTGIGLISWVFLSGALGQVDKTGALNAGLATAGLAVAVVGLRVAVTGLHNQAVAPEQATRKLAALVHEAENKQFIKLMGGIQASFQPIDTEFRVHGSNGVAASSAGSLETLAEFYRTSQPRRLVITGQGATTSLPLSSLTTDAGSGKTCLAVALIVELTREQLAEGGTASPRRVRAPGEAVPVRLSAASWNGNEIAAWLRSHLQQVYQQPAHVTKELVEKKLIIPVIDGVDEMEDTAQVSYTSRAAQLMRAVDRYSAGRSPAPVVLTCRRPVYEALIAARADPQKVAWVEIQRLSPAAISAHLRRRIPERDIERWRPVLNQLAHSGPLAQALDTPWQLTMSTAVFQETDATGNPKEDPNRMIAMCNAGTLREFLLNRFIAAMVTAHGVTEEATHRGRQSGAIRYTPEQTWRHLATLAAYLQRNATHPPSQVAEHTLSSTDLVPHELWPMALPRRPSLVSYTLASWLAFMALGAIVAAYRYHAHTAALITFAAALIPFAASCARERGGYESWPTGRPLQFRKWWAPIVLAILFACVTFMPLAILAGIVRKVIEWSGSGAVGPVNALPVFCGVGPVWWSLTAYVISITVFSNKLPLSPRAVLHRRLVMELSLCPIIALAAALGWGLALQLAARWGGDEQTAAITSGLLSAILAGAFAKNLQKSLGYRYIQFIWHSRGDLPLRLLPFLDWCYSVGILRISGIAYQFRHRELQEHLAANPAPPPLN